MKSVNKAIAIALYIIKANRNSISKCFYKKDISFIFFICLLNKKNKISAFQKRIFQTKIQSRNQFGMISHILSSMAHKKISHSLRNSKDCVKCAYPYTVLWMDVALELSLYLAIKMATGLSSCGITV